MANLSETASYDAGVYQLETTDPVQGGSSGVANAPLKNLANRTAYLKQVVDALSASIGSYAPLSSPALTGTPTAPTQALGDNSTKLATDAFVQGTVGGYLQKSVAGNANVTLTAVEAGNGILEFVGALTGNINVIVPGSPTKKWVIKNNTTGAFTLTVKTATGTGVVCSQGYNALVWTDSANVYDALTDFDSPVFTGNPTAPNPAQFDNDTSLATTAFVKRQGLATAGQINISASTTLTAGTHVGMLILGTASTPNTLTLPLASTVASGGCIAFQNAGTVATTIARQGSDYIYVASPANTLIVVQPGEFVILETDGFNWSAFGTGVLNFSPSFSNNINKPGTLIMFAGSTPPAGYIACPTAVTNVSRTTYADLFAAIGTTWGAGDGSTTFGIPYFPAGYAPIAGTPGSTSVGEVIGHSHYVYGGASGSYQSGGGYGASYGANGLGAGSTQSTGGAANLAAGSQVKFAVKY